MYSCNLALKMFCTGLLQILMLAGATGYSIQQHCEVYRDAYDTVIYPCPCSASAPKSTIRIMWVKSNANSSVMNHYTITS